MVIELKHKVNDVIYFFHENKIIEGMIKHVIINIYSEEDLDYPYSDVFIGNMGIKFRYVVIKNGMNILKDKKYPVYHRDIFTSKEDIENEVVKKALKEAY